MTGGAWDREPLADPDALTSEAAMAASVVAGGVAVEHQSEPAPEASAAALSTVTAGADVLLEVNDLKVHFPIKRGVLIDKTIGYVYAVDGVSLAVRCGGPDAGCRWCSRTRWVRSIPGNRCSRSWSRA